jgi:TPM domain
MSEHRIQRMFKHFWLDASDAKRAVPADAMQRLTQRVAASESLHTGEIRICVEAALPASYLWRLGKSVSISQLTRQRAVMLFGKLRVWDTELNNGVLIYLLLAEHAIEIVADRGLARRVPPEQWQAMAQRMGAAFREGRFEEGLSQTVEEVTGLLLAHFPAAPGAQQDNELPDEPVFN